MPMMGYKTKKFTMTDLSELDQKIGEVLGKKESEKESMHKYFNGPKEKAITKEAEETEE
jgi:hypothetical protein